MNVIFDIGMVLLDFCFEDFVRTKFGFDGETAQTVIDAMWKSGDWGELDRGVLSDEEVLQRFISHAPDCERQIRLVFARVGECPKLREFAVPMIKQLKADGHRVYYLSNYFSFLIHTAPWALEFTQYTEGGIFSCFEHLTKPDRQIYELLCERYSLDPKECVFIDDTLANVTAAQALSMKGIQYTGQSKDELISEIEN